MNLMDLLLVLIVAIVCGSVAQLTSGYSRGGWIVNLGIGFIGALAGVIFSRVFNAPVIYDLEIGIRSFPLIYAIVGSVFFLAAIGLIVKPGRR